jgi:hypothetical protein
MVLGNVVHVEVTGLALAGTPSAAAGEASNRMTFWTVLDCVEGARSL